MGRISLRVVPNSQKSEVCVWNGHIKVKVQSKPEKGRANSELIKVISERLKVSKSCVKIIKGHKSRGKVVEIEGLSSEEILRRLINK